MSFVILHLRSYIDSSVRPDADTRVASHTILRARTGIPSRRLLKSSSTLPSFRASSTSAAPVEVRQTAVRPGKFTFFDFSNSISEFSNQDLLNRSQSFAFAQPWPEDFEVPDHITKGQRQLVVCPLFWEDERTKRDLPTDDASKEEFCKFKETKK